MQTQKDCYTYNVSQAIVKKVLEKQGISENTLVGYQTLDLLLFLAANEGYFKGYIDRLNEQFTLETK